MYTPCPTLKSFVSKEDFPRLIKLLKHVTAGTLNKHVSVLVLWGGPNSGKTTLIEIMTKLAPSYGRLNSSIFNTDHINGQIPNIDEFGKSLVIGSEMSGNQLTLIMNSHKIFRQKTDEMRPLYGDYKTITLGTFVLASNVNIAEMCAEEILKLKKTRKMPLVFRLPCKFNNSKPNYDQIIRKCIQEFSEIVISERIERVAAMSARLGSANMPYGIIASIGRRLNSLECHINT